MSIKFDKNWSNQNNYCQVLKRRCSNHESSRSAADVAVILKKIGEDNWGGTLGAGCEAVPIYFKMDSEVNVLKGIHKDTKKQMHILIEINGEKYHVNVNKKYHNSKSYTWRADSVMHKR